MKKRDNFRNTKGQEEMVGFVVIVVLVVIIGLVFLMISANAPATQKAETSVVLDSFFKSVMYYTTDCEIPEGTFRDIESLITRCSNNKLCADERESCSVLERDLKNLLNNSFVVGKGSYARYYKMNLKTGIEGKPIIPEISAGNASLASVSSCPLLLKNSRTISNPSIGEKINMTLEVCYNG